MEFVAEKKLPPKYKPQIFLENLRDPFGFLARSPENYPELFRFRLLQRKVYVLNSPDFAQYVLQENQKNYLKGEAYKVLALLLGNGLINSEGDFWKRQRRLVQPAFHRESLKRVCDIVTGSTHRMLLRWKKQEGQTVNFTREMAGLTIEIVAKSLFTADVKEQDINTVWQSVNYLNSMAMSMIRNPLALPFWAPMPSYIKARKSIADLDKLVYGIINKRRQGGSFAPDLIQLLLEARDEDTGERMNEQQLRDEVMTIFLAGHETTVNALSWSWYLLKQHPQEEARLKNESMQFSGRQLLFEDMPALKFGKQVINESMRLYPPVVAVGRRLVQEDTIGDFHIPHDARVLVNIAGLHHHPQCWSEPWKFMPVRFEDFESKGSNRFVFIPFGGGPRICIGNNFAMMEMQIINAILAQHTEFELLSRNIKPVPQITLKPGKGVMVRVKRVHL